MNLAPYDAVCFISYGGPNRPDDVLPFMRNATRGSNIPDERLVEVSGHYRLFDGKSPINERNAELMAAVSQGLRERGIEIPVVIGNRNWHPFFKETLQELKDSGAKRVLCVITSAYSSYSGCRQYREDLARALADIGGGLQLDKIGPFADTSGFIAANVDAVLGGLHELPGARVLFVTHSIPEAMNAASSHSNGTNPRSAGNVRTMPDTYLRQHERVIDTVMRQVNRRTNGSPRCEYELVFCSRSGPPHVPWLEPDVNDRMVELAAEGIQRIVAVPVGFINDHMEVVYDLDTQARETAARHNLEYVRAPTASAHPELIASLINSMVLRAAVARGERSAPHDARFICPEDCCLPHPGAELRPVIA